VKGRNGGQETRHAKHAGSLRRGCHPCLGVILNFSLCSFPNFAIVRSPCPPLFISYCLTPSGLFTLLPRAKESAYSGTRVFLSASFIPTKTS
jgi:hypothetical protein